MRRFFLSALSTSTPFLALILALILATFSLSCIASAKFEIEKSPKLGQLAGFKGSELCAVSKNTLNYINNNVNDEFAVHSGSIFKDRVSENITMERVQETLAFLCTTYIEDVVAKRQSRLHDSKYLKENFEFIRWQPDTQTAKSIAKKSTNEVKSRLLNNIPEDEIFLTKYYTKLLDGSAVKTEKYNQALYALPHDEEGLTKTEALLLKDTLTRFKYTRADIIKGALLPNTQSKKLASPLVWISEESLHDVLLQGTGVLNVDGEIRYFNVHRNNGIAYDYSLGKREQDRYWYFAEVPSVMGYGDEIQKKIPIRAHVTFAGNVRQLGLGKLFMVSYKVDNKRISRLGVLADQGGAFDDNLFQLDLLVDSYRGWEDYHQANNHLPDYAQAWMVLLKR